MNRTDLRTLYTVAAAALPLSAPHAFVTVCNISSGNHTAIQKAVDDPACKEVVIAAGI